MLRVKVDMPQLTANEKRQVLLREWLRLKYEQAFAQYERCDIALGTLRDDELAKIWENTPEDAVRAIEQLVTQLQL